MECAWQVYMVFHDFKQVKFLIFQRKKHVLRSAMKLTQQWWCNVRLPINKPNNFNSCKLYACWLVVLIQVGGGDIHEPQTRDTICWTALQTTLILMLLTANLSLSKWLLWDMMPSLDSIIHETCHSNEWHQSAEKMCRIHDMSAEQITKPCLSHKGTYKWLKSEKSIKNKQGTSVLSILFNKGAVVLRQMVA